MVVTGCGLWFSTICRKNSAIRGIALDNLFGCIREDNRWSRWKMSSAKIPGTSPTSSFEEIDSQRSTCIIRARYSCRRTVKIPLRLISSRMYVRKRCTRVSLSKHIECSFIRRKSGRDRPRSSIISRDTSRRVYGFAETIRPRVRRQMHAPRVARITAVGDWKLHLSNWWCDFLRCVYIITRRLYSKFIPRGIAFLRYKSRLRKMDYFSFFLPFIV